MEGKIFNGGAVGILEELIESAEEEVLLASCRLIKLYPELKHCVGLETIMGCLPFEKFVEACKDPQDETNEMRAKTLHKIWNRQTASSSTGFPDDVHQLLIVKSNYGDHLYETILKGFREARVALKIGYYVKPWNLEASREASLQETVDKVRTIAHRRRRNVIRRDD
ncbi:hypothetical protein HID58_010674 [Brassica napus]|uniref:Factor of DNA methylation 1-5/IDN2 domain-containing protein n=1 Tax=Brassica napus TaxID=3708 RepID=A0ABQ8DVX7_BRANA|nr:uncharacterized protein LOC106443800 [Brassica napus]KAH0933557.1 hypothetical protein HID58_010674 [Brassica napus]